MKKIKFLGAIIFMARISLAQQIPTGIAPTPNNVSNDAVSAWYRGGNFPTGTSPLPTNNIFGTNWNSPIYTITSGQHRMRINGTLTTTINGVSKNVDGFVGISPSGFFASNSPAAMLHLFGPDNSSFGVGGGWRKWMSTGMLANENSDAIYVGMKPEAGTNRSDAVIGWNDDFGAGKDKLRFIFTANATGNLPVNPLSGESLNGYEFMRMSSSPNQTNTTNYPIGNVGIGPVFTDALPPQNRLHMNSEEYWSNWFQMSIQNVTGQQNTDGLKIGILGDVSPANDPRNGNAFLYNQENRHLIFGTNHPTPANMSATAERMRITSFSAPTNLPGGGYGAYTPAGATSLADATRVAISYDPASPVTRPLSLLHLGYNTGLFSFPGGSTDGWRPWMDIGMFVSNGTDNTYLGLKQEPGIFGDRQDAVLSWGDNQTPGSPVVNGPDNLRFIFTSTTTGAGGSPPATLANGLETGRFYPGRDTLGTFGRFGVGDFTASGVNETPTHKIDVVGNGRFRFLPDTLYRNDSMVKKIVFVDSLGVLRWEYADSLGLGNTARNGLTIDSGYVELGQDIGAAGDPGKLLNNREIPMNNFNILFKDPASSTANTNRVQVGSFTGVPYNQFAKLSSFNGENPVNPFRIGGFFTSSSKINVGSIPALFNPFYFGGLTPNYKFGSVSVAQDSTGAASRYIGLSGGAYSTSSQNNVGTSGKGYGSAATNYGVYGLAGGTNTSATNYGVSGSANGAGTNIGVYGSASGGVTDYAGYFDGEVYINSPASGAFIVTPSDRNIKTDIDSIANALAIIKQLSPKTFYFDTLNTHHLRLSDKKQYGVIAQEVESVLPELVSYTTKPADRDSAGNITNPAFTYKTVNYNAFIAILMKGMQEQQKAVDSLEAQTSKQDSINHSLQNQINQLMTMITDCCNASHDNGNHYGHSMAPVNVELRDGQSIVLDQNVPNPFAEQTTISYFLPDNVSKAQILFYNAQGRLIQSTELTERGKGQLNVFASDLTNGIYTYTLVADGKIMETKKMIKQ